MGGEALKLSTASLGVIVDLGQEGGLTEVEVASARQGREGLHPPGTLSPPPSSTGL